MSEQAALALYSDVSSLTDEQCYYAIQICLRVKAEVKALGLPPTRINRRLRELKKGAKYVTRRKVGQEAQA